MDASRFLRLSQAIARRLARPLTRRAAIRAGGAVALAAGSTPAVAAARQATPEATPAGTLAEGPVAYLYVQVVEGGAFRSAGEPDVYDTRGRPCRPTSRHRGRWSPPRPGDGRRLRRYHGGGLLLGRCGGAGTRLRRAADRRAGAGALIEQGLVFRPDWEAVVTPQVDWLLTRPEVDPKRIVLMGRSWGGYLAPRAATAEHRIAALVADAAQYAPGKRAKGWLPPKYRDQLGTGDPAVLHPILEAEIAQSPSVDFKINRGMLIHGSATPLDYLRGFALYTIEGLAERITCPTLVCEAENDGLGGDAKPLYDAIEAPKEYILFTNAEGAGEHDAAGAAARFNQRVFDWLDETLATVD